MAGIPVPGAGYFTEWFPDYFTPWFVSDDADVEPNDRVVDYPLFCPELESITIPRGTSATIDFTITRRDRKVATGSFLSPDAISCVIWPGEQYAVSSAPVVQWINAVGGTARLFIANSNTSALGSGDYRIQIIVTIGARKFIVHDDTIFVSTSPGSTQVPVVYCDFDDMQEIYSGLRDFQEEQSDDAGFLSMRLKARELIDYKVWNRYAPTYASIRRRKTVADPIYGFDAPDRTAIAPSRDAIRSLLESDAAITTGPEAEILRMIAAMMAVSFILSRQATKETRNDYIARSMDLMNRAKEMLTCYAMRLDTDGDGVADIEVNKSVLFLT